METTIPIGVILGLYWGYMGMMEKKMANIIAGDIGLWGLALKVQSCDLSMYEGFRVQGLETE